MDRDAFFAKVGRLTDEVFRSHREIPDHRKQHSGLTGCLGDPFAGIWLVAEAPSLGRIESVRAHDDSPEKQWSVSDGDKLFRAMLSKHGFKEGGSFECGGWCCYITDVIKSAHRCCLGPTKAG
jgi:hypothetical protein